MSICISLFPYTGTLFTVICICVSHVTVTVTWFDLFVLDMKTETACEGKTLDLRCKKGMTITTNILKPMHQTYLHMRILH
jgi:hypothetical protein